VICSVEERRAGIGRADERSDVTARAEEDALEEGEDGDCTMKKDRDSDVRWEAEWNCYHDGMMLASKYNSPLNSEHHNSIDKSCSSCI
jgi:hypothetical protein